MFANAYKLASSFTQPVITSMRFFDKTVECGCAAFVIVNNEGWIISAAHIFEPSLIFQKHTNEINDYQTKVQAIQQDASLTLKQKRKKIGHLPSNPKWITNHSFWWGSDDIQIQDIKILAPADILIGRLEPFDPKTIQAYPVFKNPSKLDIGTSLCKLGFPFYKIDSAFNENTGHFELPAGTLPIPRFPIEGMYTRNFIIKSDDGKHEFKFLETSSPGLRGQSGGSIFDAKGRIWGIQSHTRHFPLGFNPKIIVNGREIEEHQFLNVGMGIHPESIINVFKEHNIKFSMSED